MFKLKQIFAEQYKKFNKLFQSTVTTEEKKTLSYIRWMKCYLAVNLTLSPVM